MNAMKTSKQHMLEFFAKGFRIDGRKLSEFRNVQVEIGVSPNAEGSARVKIGSTEVLAGVKLELGTPYPDKPDEGTIMVGAELLPLSSPDFEAGPPGITAIELARVVDRGIREAGVIDFKRLCITPGEKAWIVVIDIISVNDEGNLFDAAALAAIAAVKDCRFPSVSNGVINYKDITDERLPLNEEAVEVTVHKIGSAIFIDPSLAEEQLSEARITVAVTRKGELCALQKGGDFPLIEEDIYSMIDLAVQKSRELRKLI